MKLNELLEQITPLPWNAEISTDERSRECAQVNARKQFAVADMCGRDDRLKVAQANAAYLCHAANVLPELVRALESLIEKADDPELEKERDFVMAVDWDSLRAALALAQEVKI